MSAPQVSEQDRNAAERCVATVMAATDWDGELAPNDRETVTQVLASEFAAVRREGAEAMRRALMREFAGASVWKSTTIRGRILNVDTDAVLAADAGEGRDGAQGE